MIVATDVQYTPGPAGNAAIVGFEAWASPAATMQRTAVCAVDAPYRAGHFAERELPCVLPLVRDACALHPVRAVVVDGYVELPGRLGLGGHLQRALHAEGIVVAVVGVAKNPFVGAPAVAVRRGTSTRPLFVSALGVEVAQAAAWISDMHGPHRIPTLLRLVDALARGHA